MASSGCGSELSQGVVSSFSVHPGPLQKGASVRQSPTAAVQQLPKPARAAVWWG